MRAIHIQSIAGRGRPLALFIVLVLCFCTGAAAYWKAGIYGIAGALILLGLVALMLAKPDRATIVGIFAIYANLGAMFLHYHHTSPMVASVFFGVLAVPFLLPLTYYVVIRREEVLIDLPLYLMVMYFATLLASVFFAIDPTQSTGKMLSYGLEGVALYFLVLNTVRTPTLLRKAIYTLLGAGLLMGTLSIYQVATHSYSTTFGGLAQIQKKGVSTGQSEPGEESTPGRVAGPVGETNRYAQVMVVLLPLGIFQLFSERSRRRRMMLAAACIPIMIAVLLTFSRGAGVAILLMLSAMLVLGYVRLKHVATFAGAMLVVVFLAAPAYIHRMSTLGNLGNLLESRAVGVDSSSRDRATLYIASAKVFLDHPLLGVGPGQARYFMARYSTAGGFDRIEGTKRSHNMYLEELANTGVIGFAAFMSVLLVLLKQLTTLRKQLESRSYEYSCIVTGLFFSILTYLFTALFLHLSYERYYWILLALAGAAIQILRPTIDHPVTIER